MPQIRNHKTTDLVIGEDMGSYDDVRFERASTLLPDGLPLSGWQTRELDGNYQQYVITEDGTFAKEERPSKVLMYTRVGSGDIELFDGHTRLVVTVKDGLVTDVVIGELTHDEGGLEPEPVWIAM